MTAFRITTFQFTCQLIGVVVITLHLLASQVSAETNSPVVVPKLVQQAEQARIKAINKARPSAVSVFMPGGGGGGSGVLISPEGYALTNFHVTSPAGSYMKCGLSDGRVYDAVLVGLDPVGDLAMIKLLGRDDFPVATLGDSLKSKAGDECMVIGNPFLLATNLQPTVTYGILSGVGRYQYPSGTLLEYADCLQTDASINPGNSGGPLYSSQGDLLGIVGRGSFEKRGRVNVGVGYAISINQAKNFLGYLSSGRIVDHATLGATVTTDPDGGVVVSNILESSDAYRRGMRYNSEILELAGRPVSTANDVQNVLGTLPNGWRIPITFREEGKTIETLVRLPGVHRRDELLTKMASAMPPPPPVPDQPGDKPDNQEDQPQRRRRPAQRPDPNAPQPNAPQPKTPKPESPKPQPHGPGPGGARKKPVKIPPQAMALIKNREGFANYYFNQQNQDRCFKSLQDQFPAGETWKLTGKTADGKDIKLLLSNEKCVVSLGDRSLELKAKSDFFDAVDTGNDGALLVALDSLRRLMLLGPEKFGETYYWGTMPLGGQRPLRDCMLGTSQEIEHRWLMHPETGALECIEAFADRDTDPAEAWLEYDNGKLTGLDLRFGVESKRKITELQIEFDAQTTSDAAPAKETAAANDGEDQ
ncbi:MAG: serine protease [Rhodopirellula sp. TMED11]|nr:MAG: serine protease [Rhodopirellula sp. TMED11]